MKKLLRLSMLVLGIGLLMGLYSCDPKNKTQEAAVPDKEIVAECDGILNVETAVSADREYMYLHYQNDYRWYEAQIVLSDYLDAEGQTGAIESITNVFQVVTPYDSVSADVEVVMFTHTPNDVLIIEKHGFWVEDIPLNDQNINLTFAQAYDKVMSANCPKPHSRHCVLRKEVGPVDANPQYIFGNSRAQLYVDAVTGEVSNNNPAFGDSGLAKPLGEWP